MEKLKTTVKAFVPGLPKSDLVQLVQKFYFISTVIFHTVILSNLRRDRDLTNNLEAQNGYVIKTLCGK